MAWPHFRHGCAGLEHFTRYRAVRLALHGGVFVVLGQFAAGRSDAGRVQPQIGQQFGPFAVLDETIGNTQAADATGVE